MACQGVTITFTECVCVCARARTPVCACGGDACTGESLIAQNVSFPPNCGLSLSKTCIFQCRHKAVVFRISIVTSKTTGEVT
jgi:hypothetical protein